MAKKTTYIGTGRRKSAIAQVRMVAGTGKITVNGKDAKDFFPSETNILDLSQPLVATETEKTFDVEAKVIGGGYTGQAGAIRLGIARALLEYDAPNVESGNSYRKVLKKLGLISRDSRIKERKKPGLKGARRAPQFSKR